MYKTYSMELAGRTLRVDIGRMAAQANGAVLMHYGDTVVLSTATASEKPREGIDFFPLSVEYEEKQYSVGKIPGGFKKREGRATDNAVLTARMIDRPMRPLFPDDYRNDVNLSNLILCVDQDAGPEITASLGSVLATLISDIPFNGPMASTQIGLIDGEFIVNPTGDEREVSDLDLIVSSTDKKVIMIEAGANEVSEEVMMEAIVKAHEVNQEIIKFFNDIVKENNKEKHEYERFIIPEDLIEDIKSRVSFEEMEEAVFSDVKQIREANVNEIKEKLNEAYEEEHEDWLEYIDAAMEAYQEKVVRKMILKDRKRPDGRKIDEIRNLESEIDVLPRTHGSGMFTRGQTQVLNVTTLASLADVQRLDGLDENETSKRYMHHYNFPSFSVGETRPSRGPGRREIGHGDLAEKALIPVLPSEEDFPYAIRTVSEVLESNGSSSQASICSSSLSLMAAGVPITSHVAGISAGLVTGETDDDYIILTDIQGLEDFYGDMDFKVAGTHKGITAIQMDLKNDGLTKEIIKDAIDTTKKARTVILNESMTPCIEKPREQVNEYAPKITQIQIDPEKIGDVIGKQGKHINAIIEQTEVKIDISDEGEVSISGYDMDKINEAIELVKTITTDFEKGEYYKGTVVNIRDFGAFIEFAPGKEGMVHISKISNEHVNRIEDYLSLGDEVTVVCLGKDRQGRVSFSMKGIDQ